MAQPKCSDEEFVRLFSSLGAAGAARELGISDVRSVYYRRRRLEKSLGRPIRSPNNLKEVSLPEYPQRVQYEIEDGIIPIGSDAHIWPGPLSTAMRAFIKFCEWHRDEIPLVIWDGDFFDGARISRFPPIGWEDKPSVKDELLAVREVANKVEAVIPDAEKVWCMGNHDARFESRLSSQAPEFEGVHGFHLKDFFGEWVPCWSCFINDDIVVKHRFKGGIHATHNNAMWSGRTMVTGHLHSAKVTPLTDYNGTRYGVDCGTLAEPMGQQFADYTEDSPLNWRSGFAVLTIKGGRLLQPELVQVWDENSVQFRGQIYEV